jgi:hypothetical protein
LRKSAKMPATTRTTAMIQRMVAIDAPHSAATANTGPSQQHGPLREAPQLQRAARDGSRCGLMSSIVPYVSDLPALRRAPAQMISTFTSINRLLRRYRSARAAMIKRPATPVRYLRPGHRGSVRHVPVAPARRGRSTRTLLNPGEAA